MKIGIVIPYYENSEEAKERMEYLLDIISPQIKKNIELVVIDDGMSALWLDEYSKKNIADAMIMASRITRVRVAPVKIPS